MTQEKARVVKSHDIHIDADYSNWIAELNFNIKSMVYEKMVSFLYQSYTLRKNTTICFRIAIFS